MVFIISLLVIWILSIILLFVNPEDKVNRWASFAAVLIIPTSLMVRLQKSLRPDSGTHSFGPYIGIVLLLILYSYFIFKNKPGIKPRLERKNMVNDGVMADGGSILSHAIKNEMAKISLCNRNIQASAHKFDLETFQSYIGENTKNIQVSVDYLFKIIKRIHDFAGEITLIESYANLLDIIEEAINLVSVYLQARKITLQRNYPMVNTDFFCIAMRYT
jgi:two-component system sporulation sensor kinase B